jgi:hypothetical protein
MERRFSIEELMQVLKDPEYMPDILEPSVLELLQFACREFKGKADLTLNTRDEESRFVFSSWIAVSRIIEALLKKIEQDGLQRKFLAAPDLKTCVWHDVKPSLSLVSRISKSPKE